MEEEMFENLENVVEKYEMEGESLSDIGERKVRV